MELMEIKSGRNANVKVRVKREVTFFMPKKSFSFGTLFRGKNNKKKKNQVMDVCIISSKDFSVGNISILEKQSGGIYQKENYSNNQ